MCILLVVMIFGQSSTVTAQTVTEIRQELSQALQQSVQYQNDLDNLLAEADDVDKELDPLRQQLLDDLTRNKGKLSDDLNNSYQKTQAIEIELSNMRQQIARARRIVYQQDNKIYQYKQTLIDKLGFTALSWPLAEEGKISSDYGNRMHPIFDEVRFHTGVDLAVDMGVVIKASAEGVVTLSESLNGYGLTVVIDHGHGLSTLYGHASELLVKAGDIVKVNDPIALVGSTGISTGPHLHFEVHQDNQHIDPGIWLD